jgi:N-methylhydantoinase A
VSDPAKPATQRRFRIGIDVGGTFVDCVIRRDDVVVAAAKAPSVPADPVGATMDALVAAAGAASLDVGELLASTSAIVHGTTVGLNTLLTRTGSRVGLLTTRGHEDAILIGRVHQKVAGLRADERIRVSELRKPDPLVPRWRIHGIHERLDARGQEVVALDEAGVVDAARRLAEEACSAIAICFLWSPVDPAHEQRAAALVAEAAPGVRVALSSEVAPVLGEYERCATTVVNAYLLGVTGDYLRSLEAELGSLGYRGDLSVILSGGGVVPATLVADRPVELLGSGPVGGVTAATAISRQIRSRAVIATDMGGTSFDVGLVIDGAPETIDVTVVGQLHLAVPAIDVRSIGAGGGSVAWVDEEARLHVGPRAAPPGVGPACYGLGGREPTVTDADLVLGRLDPNARLGGRILPDRAAAEAAIAAIGTRLSLDVPTTAAAIVRIADAQAADLVRNVTVESGHDPEQFVLLAYGGAGPLHVGGYGPELGVGRAIVPASASVLSADGLALAGWRRTYRRSMLMTVPPDRKPVAAGLAELAAAARRDHRAAGSVGRLRLERLLDLRYGRQTHSVSVRVPTRIDADALEGLLEDFERRYELIHGPGSGYRPAGIELTSLRLVATAAGPSPGRPTRSPARQSSRRAPARSGVRSAWFAGQMRQTPVFAGRELAAGSGIDGPALIDWPTTTLVLHPGQVAVPDRFGHVHVELRAAG